MSDNALKEFVAKMICQSLGVHEEDPNVDGTGKAWESWRLVAGEIVAAVRSWDEANQ